MTGPAPTGRQNVFTIGHSNHSQEAFLNILRDNRIEALVDVRSNPYSKYTPHFNLDAIEKWITAAATAYLYMGRELGGRPEEPEFYDADGGVLYQRLEESPRFLEGIDWLEKQAATSRIAVMCGEENPAECHRRFLIGQLLAARGVVVRHIRGDARVQTEAELRLEELRGQDEGQLMLFAPEEVAEWKSSP